MEFRRPAAKLGAFSIFRLAAMFVSCALTTLSADARPASRPVGSQTDTALIESPAADSQAKRTAFPTPAVTPLDPPPSNADYYRWRQAQFERVIAVGYRISVAAAENCPGSPAIIGLVVDHPYQYLPGSRMQVGFRPHDSLPRVIAIAKGSPADRAGLLPGDRIEVAPPPRTVSPAKATFGANELAAGEIEQRIAAGKPTTFVVLRDGTRREFTLNPTPGCGGWFDMRQSQKVNASSNSRWIQLTEGTLGRVETADGLAFVIGHEMAHRAARRVPGHEKDKCGPRCEEATDRMATTQLLPSMPSNGSPVPGT